MNLKNTPLILSLLLFAITTHFSVYAQIQSDFWGNKVYTIVQQMPVFPSCAEKTSHSDRKKCSEENTLKYIHNNIKYPLAARKLGIEGMVVISFVVDIDGSIINAEILRDLGGGCGEEALRVVNSFPKWIPGKQEGKHVKVQFNLPVRFTLTPSKGSQVVLTNQWKLKPPFENGMGASSFLVHTNNGIRLITAKHLIGKENQTMSEIPTDELNKSLNAWIAFPRPYETPDHWIEATKLVNEKPSTTDILVFKVIGDVNQFKALIPNYEPVKKGAKLLMLGCQYKNKDCVQNEYPLIMGNYEDGIGWATNESMPELSGFSGAPILDKHGFLVGVLLYGKAEAGFLPVSRFRKWLEQ